MPGSLRSRHSPVIENYDEVLLPLLADAGGWITTARVAQRCEDPWATDAAVAGWLQDAADRKLAHVRRFPRDGPLEWRLSSAGRRALRRRKRP